MRRENKRSRANIRLVVVPGGATQPRLRLQNQKVETPFECFICDWFTRSSTVCINSALGIMGGVTFAKFTQMFELVASFDPTVRLLRQQECPRVVCVCFVGAGRAT